MTRTEQYIQRINALAIRGHFECSNPTADD